MEPIRSPRNRAVFEAARLHRPGDRRRFGRTLVEGPHVLAEAIAAGVVVRQTFHLADVADHDWPNPTPVTDVVLARVAGTEHPRGPVAVIDIPAPVPPPTDRSVLVLWGVADPGNVGTMIRSAAAFGLGVGIGPETADPWGPKVLRSAAGAHFLIPISIVTAPGDLTGHRLAATVTQGGIDPRSLEAGPWAVIIGSEAHGLDPEVVAAADSLVSIPMPGRTESLNAAVAASIIAYELANRSGSQPARH